MRYRLPIANFFFQTKVGRDAVDSPGHLLSIKAFDLYDLSRTS